MLLKITDIAPLRSCWLCSTQFFALSGERRRSRSASHARQLGRVLIPSRVTRAPRSLAKRKKITPVLQATQSKLLEDVKEPTLPFEKGRGRKSRCCGLATFIHGSGGWVDLDHEWTNSCCRRCLSTGLHLPRKQITYVVL